MKKAYVVAEVRVHNPGAYEGYRELATESVARFGGRFVVRGGTRVQREGKDAEHDDSLRTVIVEFPSLAQAQAWYDSPEYRKAKDIRIANSTGRLFIVEGVEEQGQ